MELLFREEAQVLQGMDVVARSELFHPAEKEVDWVGDAHAFVHCMPPNDPAARCYRSLPATPCNRVEMQEVGFDHASGYPTRLDQLGFGRITKGGTLLATVTALTKWFNVAE